MSFSMIVFTTFDVMADLTFGESLHMLDKVEYGRSKKQENLGKINAKNILDPWVRTIFSQFKVATRVNIIRHYYPLACRIFDLLLNKPVSNLREKHFNHSVTRVTKRLAKGRETEGVDLWDLVLQQEDKGKIGLTRGQMDSNSSLFMIAGTETTATLLSGLTYLLLTHPGSMKKLVEEIRGAFTTSDDIAMTAIAKLPYLKACISEALRLYPPVPAGLPHLTPIDGSTICGHFVPPGVSKRPVNDSRKQALTDPC